MRRLRTPFVGMALVAGFAASHVAQAAPALRVQVDQHGDFLLIGNTLGWECQNEPDPPTIGTGYLTACSGITAYDSAPDLFWRSDAPTAGQATVDASYQPADAATTAVLTIPNGATVTHAYLYWAAKKGSTPATQVSLERPGTAGFPLQTLTADASFTTAGGSAYESVVKVTDLVRQHGSGAYRVSGTSVTPFASDDEGTAFGAWAMVVFYELSSDPPRNLALFDGMDIVSIGNNQSVTLNGFLVPNGGFEGKLGVIAYEGDSSVQGDQLFFNGGAALFDTPNPAMNFFNSSRTWLGSPITVVGDLPQLTGQPKSMTGVDLDVVDISGKLVAGQTQAVVQATTSQDEYYLGAFITSITMFRPDFATSTKTVKDVNGGTLLAGETLEYTLTIENKGNDASVRTVANDPLPTGVTYVPDSMAIKYSGTLTNVANTSVGGYDATTHTIVARLGTGATATDGGSIPVDGNVTVTFQVRVNAGKTGVISNQAVVSAAGERGSPAAETLTDGNGTTAVGSPTTDIFAEECSSNANCSAPKPVCDTTVSPRVCVACLTDPDCGLATSGKVCLPNRTCVDGCRASGINGCPTGDVCKIATAESVGICVECQVDSDCGGPNSGQICNTATNVCVDGCRVGDNICPVGDVCRPLDATNTTGTCVDCLTDADCGAPSSGKVCDPATNICRDGCHGECATGVCTSTDATTIGMCVECTTDANCGTTLSGRVCEGATHACQDGCRGVGGNGCQTNLVCTSVDTTIGACVQCIIDATCGGVNSGKVCDYSIHACRDGCRAIGGNGCPTDDACSSIDTSIGYCSGVAGSTGVAGQTGQGGAATGGLSATGGRSKTSATINWNEVVAQGNGCACRTASEPTRRSTAWLVGFLVAAGAMRRRRQQN